MFFKESRQFNQVQILKEDLVFKKLALIAANQGILWDIVLTWEFRISKEQCHNMLTNPIIQMEWEKDQVEPKGLKDQSPQGRLHGDAEWGKEQSSCDYRFVRTL